MTRTTARSMLAAVAIALLANSISIADEHEREKEWIATPIEMYACDDNERREQDDFDADAARFNGWADEEELTEYPAWQPVPFSFGAQREFDFESVTAHDATEERGKDWDRYNHGGWQNEDEPFAGKLSCDLSRVYIARSLRRAKSNVE